MSSSARVGVGEGLVACSSESLSTSGGLGRYWAAQWHLAQAVGKRFRGCRAKRLHVHGRRQGAAAARLLVIGLAWVSSRPSAALPVDDARARGGVVCRFRALLRSRSALLLSIALASLLY